jgi:hypothetical protein
VLGIFEPIRDNKLRSSTDAVQVKPPALERLEPRILLSGDGLLNIVPPNPLQDMLINSTPEVVQHVDSLENEGRFPTPEQEISPELDVSDELRTGFYQPLITLSVDDAKVVDSVVKARDDLAGTVNDPGERSEDPSTLTAVAEATVDIRVTKNSHCISAKDDSIPTNTKDADSSIEYATSIEIRGPPTTKNASLNTFVLGNCTVSAGYAQTFGVESAHQLKVPDLPGLQLVDPNIVSWTEQFVYLDVDGEQGITYNGPVLIEDINIPAFSLPGKLAGQERAAISKVIKRLNCQFADFGIVFTSQKPNAGQAYSTVYIGGNNSAFSQYGSFLGLAEQVDAGNRDRWDKAFVFTENIVHACANLDSVVTELTELIGHETAHLLGYAHNSDQPRGGVLSSVANTAYSTAVQAQGPVAYYSLNQIDGWVAADTSGSGLHGEYRGDPVLGLTAALNRTQEAMVFDGSDDYVEVANDPALNPYRQVSISFWLRAGAMPANGYSHLIDKGNSAHSRAYGMLLQNNGSLILTGAVAGGQSYSLVQTAANTIIADQWYHVAGIIDRESGEMQIYINGELNEDGECSTGDIFASDQPLRIGYTSYLHTGLSFFDGMIHEVGIFDRALSAEKISTQYTQGFSESDSPVVLYIEPLSLQAGVISDAVYQFKIRLSEDLQSTGANASTSWELRWAGLDGILDNSDDEILSISPNPVYSSGTTVSLEVIPGPLQEGNYRIKALASVLADLDGNPLDGNGDGTSGDDFEHFFSVEMPEGTTVENTFNDTQVTATPLSLVEDPLGSGYFVARGLGSIEPSLDIDWRSVWTRRTVIYTPGPIYITPVGPGWLVTLAGDRGMMPLSVTIRYRPMACTTFMLIAATAVILGVPISFVWSWPVGSNWRVIGSIPTIPHQMVWRWRRRATTVWRRWPARS